MPKKSKKNKHSNQMLSLTVAKSISEIIRFSVDDDFRKRSFQALGVLSTHQVEKKVLNKLLTCIKTPSCLRAKKIENEHGLTETDNVNKDLEQTIRKCEELTEEKQDLSETIYSQICQQILQEQERRRAWEKNFYLNTNLGLANPFSKNF